MGSLASVSPGVRSVLLASSNEDLRQRLRASLAGMRWTVHEADGGASAIAQMEIARPEALLMDSWLPDLEAGEFAGQLAQMYPGVDVLRMDGGLVDGVRKSPRRHELLHALREVQEFFDAEPVEVVGPHAAGEATEGLPADVIPFVRTTEPARVETDRMPEMVGRTAEMVELKRMVRLVAPTEATVLIEGETGTGKELVAHAVHRLSRRAERPFVVLNCAAIPEALLEAELFGHTRGAFTGAVQSRTGRIEAADGGTLFLDEIGEMPLALQAKMLRFLECGEIQRVGDNATVRVDVRVIAATHRNLEKNAAEGLFRLDLYHRLSVFPIDVPALRERMDDVPLLAEAILAEFGKDAPRKKLSEAALEKLMAHAWPGNVRELRHALQRALILAAESMEIGGEEIRLRRIMRD